MDDSLSFRLFSFPLVISLAILPHDYHLYTINAAQFQEKLFGIQRGNQNPYIEDDQTTQWPKEKGQKDKQ